MTTLLTHALAPDHTVSGHPESAERGAAILALLAERRVMADCKLVAPVPASLEQIRRIHSAAMIERVRQSSARGGVQLLDGDTYTTAATFESALLAVGSCCTAVDQLLTGQADNGLLLVRPPGHHAERYKPGGFCLFNNAAAAARQAQTVHGLRRVLIVDFDVHHGNGGQDIFYEDETVLFISSHVYAPYFYPGTGSATEIGAQRGRGYTLNAPLPRGVGDEGYGRLFEQIILPKARAFKPELILVSAGFDAHWADPLGVAALSLTGYARLTRLLIELAHEVCDGRILFILEGGYFLQSLAHAVLNTAYALTGQDQLLDPLGPAQYGEPALDALLLRLAQLHLLN
jgi:acetoin utilization deacetylase AcuC-like enzyme